MSIKTFVWTGMFIGSTIGGFVPALWGESLVSFSGVVLSSVGAGVGVWAGYKLGRSMGA